MATGKNASPRLPPAILHTLVGFSGEIVHSSRVSGLEALAKRKVCIVGMGNSACDLAVGKGTRLKERLPSIHCLSVCIKQRENVH